MHIWHEGMDPRIEANGAYWERNMLTLLMATFLNRNEPSEELSKVAGQDLMVNSGWYNDTDNNWDGWKRVVSLDNGKYCFHVPDNLDLGSLPEIEKNWDGHNTETKWLRVLDQVGAPDRRSLNQWCRCYKITHVDWPQAIWSKGPQHENEPVYLREEFAAIIKDCRISINLGDMEEVTLLCRGDKTK